MIKIIKEGKKEFTQTCRICGCEFSYELSDLKSRIAYTTVSCPCCGNEIIHSDVGREYSQDFPISPRNNKEVTSIPTIGDNMVYKTAVEREFQKQLDEQMKKTFFVDCNKTKSPCETCPYWLKLKSGQTYVGDSPCQWCQYSGLKVTCTSTGTSINGVK